ncbi:hypothetical protein [Klenkia terrae]|uniref:hypothetical protein n=1 Tax=Klenkia terrae TaxID=1052259 RepID=UPI0030102EC5
MGWWRRVPGRAPDEVGQLSVLRLLDAHPGNGVPAIGSPWEREVEESLADRDWRAAVQAEGLSRDRSWVLLGWVEDAATRVARDCHRSTLTTAAYALAMLEVGRVDRRDVLVVAALLHRAADLAGLRWDRGVEDAVARAGGLGATWLPTVPAATPATHGESGAGRSFAFVRRPATFDPVALERRLDPEVAQRRVLLGQVAGLLRAVQRGPF